MTHRARRLSALLCSISLLGLVACLPDYEPDTMDDPSTEDPALTTPEAFVLSERIPNPTAADLAKPVVITAHGFQASTYEWVEFRDYAEPRGALVSLIVLGGHGRSTEAWVQTNWQDWGAPILEEYRALAALGYENISIFCSSTGCPLTYEHIAEGRFDAFPALNQLVMVAPFLVPQNELLYNTRLVGPFIGNLPTVQSEEEKRQAYHNRPWSVFVDLVDTINIADGHLTQGISLPNTNVTILRATDESTVAPESADRFIEGTDAARDLELIEYESEHHIFTRRSGRPAPDELTAQQVEDGLVPWTTLDQSNYDDVMARMVELLGLSSTL